MMNLGLASLSNGGIHDEDDVVGLHGMRHLQAKQRGKTVEKLNFIEHQVKYGKSSE